MSPQIVDFVLVIFFLMFGLIFGYGLFCEWYFYADLQQPEIESEVAEANNVWQYYTVTN